MALGGEVLEPVIAPGPVAPVPARARALWLPILPGRFTGVLPAALSEVRCRQLATQHGTQSQLQ